MYTRPQAVHPHDARKGIADAEDDSELAQVAYDSINRMTTLLGDMTFGELFTGKWSAVMPKIKSNVGEALKYDLFTDSRSKACCSDLDAASALGITFKGYLNGAAENEGDATKLLISLRKHGLHLPFRIKCEARNRALTGALDKVLSDPKASSMTYRSLLQKPDTPHPRQTVSTLRFAIKSGLVHIAATYQCCSNGQCQTCPTSLVCMPGCAPVSTLCGAR